MNGALHYPGKSLSAPKPGRQYHRIFDCSLRDSWLERDYLWQKQAYLPPILHVLIRRVFGQRFDHAALAYKAMPAGIERVLQFAA